ncbi:DUF2610 domain-containing protein [Micromonospora maris]|uniref:DUF2610 domain-containing protein n=1 Tax=Micromonospora maris TaxID=1003110 RepID=UPI002E161802|nr:DUF2610 domain-containing protein [Micromonospora maris]
MITFVIQCQFGTVHAPFTFHIGEPAIGTNPIEQQSAWLQRARGGSVPIEVMDAFETLLTSALENNVSFEELYTYAMEEATSDSEAADENDAAPTETDNNSADT